MCVEIIKPEETVSYRLDLPFQEQVCDSKEVLIDCDTNCEKVQGFLDEVQKACQCGQNIGFKIKLTNLNDLQLFKKTKKLNNDLLVNDIIRHIVDVYNKTDNKLRELSDDLKG
jgi:hypothetical protein